MKCSLHIKAWVSGCLLAVLAWACTRPAAHEFPPHQPVPVLHSYTALGDTFKVSLDRTMSFEEVVPDTLHYIRDAVVLLYEEGVLRDTLPYHPAREQYISRSVVAAAGKTYKVVALPPSFDPVEAVATAPYPVTTAYLSHAPGNRTSFNSERLDDLTFSVADPAGRNYYMAALRQYSVGSFCVFSTDPAFEGSVQEVVPFDPNDCILNTRLLFTDKTFNGTTRELTISVHPYYLRPFSPRPGETYKPYLTIYHVTEDFYRYIRDGNNTDYSVEFPTLAEPARIKGNVKGGYGMFTVFATTTDSIP